LAANWNEQEKTQNLSKPLEAEKNSLIKKTFEERSALEMVFFNHSP